MSFRIYRDEYTTTQKVTNSTVLPIIDSNNPPDPQIPGIGGGIAYDGVTQKVYYSNGYTWLPISSGSGGSSVESYSMIKDNPPQSIPPSTPSTLTDWTAPLPYEASPQWDMSTGIYTATETQSMSITAGISWAPGTNLGVRYLRILYNGNSVKEAITQAVPSQNIDTTQEVSINLSLSVGDTVSIEVEHTAPVPVLVAAGNKTSVSGVKIVV